jgi:hypothetical protein
MKPALDSSLVFVDLSDAHATLVASVNSPREVRRAFTRFIDLSQKLTSAMRKDFSRLGLGNWEASKFQGWTPVTELLKHLRNEDQHGHQIHISVHERRHFPVPENLPPGFARPLSDTFVFEGTWELTDQLLENPPDGIETFEFNPTTGQPTGKPMQLLKLERLYIIQARTEKTRQHLAAAGLIDVHAISALASRHAALDKRRLEAVDQLWGAFNALAPARSIVAMMGSVNFEFTAKEAESNSKLRHVFELINNGFDIRALDLSAAAKARPFVSQMAWAVYSAIQAVTFHSVMRLEVIKSGLGTSVLADHKAIEKLVIAALPHYMEYLEKNGPSVYYYVLEALDVRLLAELQSMLSGVESDKASLEQAAEIIRLANALQAATKQGNSEA